MPLPSAIMAGIIKCNESPNAHLLNMICNDKIHWRMCTYEGDAYDCYITSML